MLTDQLDIRHEKDKAMKDSRSTESLNFSGTADTPEAVKVQ